MFDSPLRILVVEDDADARENLQDFLDHEEHEVTLAGSLGEAMALGRYAWRRFDVALLDRRLPDGYAEAFLPRIRELAPDCAAVIITAWCERDDLITAMRGGIFDVLIKPLDPASLRATLDRLIRLRDAERRAREAERLAALGRMMAVLGHEGRNALNRISLGLNLIHRSRLESPETAEMLQITQAACEELERLFDDLRDQASTPRLDRRPCDLDRIALEAWDDLLNRRAGRDARLLIEGTPSARAVPADPFRIKQVFRNLFENALAAAPDPVEVRVRCEDSPADARPMLRLTIRDNGPGFSPEARRTAFEPFFTTKADGTGLGLSICRQIIEAHGGRISLAPSPTGADFVILLPIPSSMGPNGSKPPSTRQADPSPSCLLL